MAVVFEDQHLQVLHKAGNMPFAVATFDTRDGRADGQTFWAQSLSDKYGVECFGFVPKAPNWYPTSSIRATAIAILPMRCRPLIGYGHSMGGYACLKYSALLDLAGVVSSGPQITIDPSESGSDIRYIHHFNAALNGDMRIRANDLNGRLVVAYDPVFKFDRLHVEAISALSAGVELIPLPNMMHRTVLALRPRDVLLPLFYAILSGDCIKSIVKTARSNRRFVPQYIIYLARQLLQQSRPALAERVLAHLPTVLDPTLDKERKLYLGRICARLGRYDQARHLFMELTNADPKTGIYFNELKRVEALISSKNLSTAQVALT